MAVTAERTPRNRGSGRAGDRAQGHHQPSRSVRGPPFIDSLKARVPCPHRRPGPPGACHRPGARPAPHDGRARSGGPGASGREPGRVTVLLVTDEHPAVDELDARVVEAVGALDGVLDVTIHHGVLSPSAGRCSSTSCTKLASPSRRRLQDAGAAHLLGQGRRWQVVGDGEPLTGVGGPRSSGGHRRTPTCGASRSPPCSASTTRRRSSTTG